VVYSAELLTDFSYVNFTVSYRDALDRLRVQLNVTLLFQRPLRTQGIAEYSTATMKLDSKHEMFFNTTPINERHMSHQ